MSFDISKAKKVVDKYLIPVARGTRKMWFKDISPDPDRQNKSKCIWNNSKHIGNIQLLKDVKDTNSIIKKGEIFVENRC